MHWYFVPTACRRLEAPTTTGSTSALRSARSVYAVYTTLIPYVVTHNKRLDGNIPLRDTYRGTILVVDPATTIRCVT